MKKIIAVLLASLLPMSVIAEEITKVIIKENVIPLSLEKSSALARQKEAAQLLNNEEMILECGVDPKKDSSPYSKKLSTSDNDGVFHFHNEKFGKVNWQLIKEQDKATLVGKPERGGWELVLSGVDGRSFSGFVINKKGASTRQCKLTVSADAFNILNKGLSKHQLARKPVPNKMKGGRYLGTLIDAHSQVRCDLDPMDAKRHIEKNRDIDYVLLSAGGCYKNEKYFSFYLNTKQQHSKLSEAALSSSKIFYLAGMKDVTNKNNKWDLGKNNKWDLGSLDDAFGINTTDQFVGAAEILIQHAIWDGGDKRLTTMGVNVDLEDSNLEKIINKFKARKFPLILHLELGDASYKSDKTVASLGRLLQNHPDQKFVLIHLAQASPDIAKSLLQRYKNVYFLTSMASGFNQIVTRGKEVHHQSGWNTFFNVESRSMKQHVKNPEWRSEWLALVNGYPDRFVFALDNVFKGNWENRFPKELKIWRNALGQLDSSIAVQIACDNAKQLWSLPVECGFR